MSVVAEFAADYNNKPSYHIILVDLSLKKIKVYLQ